MSFINTSFFNAVLSILVLKNLWIHSLPAVYLILTTEDLVNHGFQDPRYVSDSDINQVFLPLGTTNPKNGPYIEDWPLDQ